MPSAKRDIAMSTYWRRIIPLTQLILHFLLLDYQALHSVYVGGQTWAIQKTNAAPFSCKRFSHNTIIPDCIDLINAWLVFHLIWKKKWYRKNHGSGAWYQILVLLNGRWKLRS